MNCGINIWKGELSDFLGALYTCVFLRADYEYDVENGENLIFIVKTTKTYENLWLFAFILANTRMSQNIPNKSLISPLKYTFYTSSTFFVRMLVFKILVDTDENYMPNPCKKDDGKKGYVALSRSGRFFSKHDGKKGYVDLSCAVKN